MQKHLDMRTQHKTAINSGTQANAPEMRLRMMVLASTQQGHKNCFFQHRDCPRLNIPNSCDSDFRSVSIC